MKAANTISPLKDWRYGIPGHGKPLTEKEKEELLEKQWSKNPSPLVNPILGNQLRINPGNPRDQLLSNAGPSTPIGTNYTLGSLNQDYGAGRVRNIRFKDGKSLRELLQMAHQV